MWIGLVGNACATASVDAHRRPPPGRIFVHRFIAASPHLSIGRPMLRRPIIRDHGMNRRKRAASLQPLPDSLMHGRDYFAAAGNAGNLPMSRRSCWMMTTAFRFAAIFLKRSSEAMVAARSVLKLGTPLLS